MVKWFLDKLEKAIKKLADKLTPPPLSKEVPTVKYFLSEGGKLNKSEEDSCYDISSINDTFILDPRTRATVSTGLYVELPKNFEIQIRPRSGLAIKNAITILNSPSTIDPGYRGEIKIILQNHSSASFTVEKGMRIAQIFFNKIDPVNLMSVSSQSELKSSKRGSKGFGSTGLK